MEKFTELQKGTFVRKGTEYDYVVEIAENFPKEGSGNVRLRIIEERPAIRKIRTRYDPQIQAIGDSGASIELSLGYDMRQLSKAFPYFLYTVLSPFLIAGMVLLYAKMDSIPRLPEPVGYTLIPLTVILAGIALKHYTSMSLTAFAEYLKARDLIRVLKREGHKISEAKA